MERRNSIFTSSTFVEEVKMLFRRADPEMREEKKVRFLMREVKQELFAGLIRNPPRTTAEFVTEASEIERTLDMRSRQYNRPLNAFLADPVNVPGLATEDLRETIRAVVREELKRLFLTTPQHQITSVTDVIREEV